MIDYYSIIKKIYDEVSVYGIGKGKVADYIPALKNVNPKQYGIAITTLDGQTFKVGDAQTKFSIQSISKVFTLAMAVRIMGKELWERVGKEPSGTSFNSLVQLEYENGIPRNPLINAGAIVITDLLSELLKDPKKEILSFVRQISGSDDIYYNKIVKDSELEHAQRNIALTYLMKSFGNINSDVDKLMDIYCSQCSIEMNCVELARSFLFLANRGLNPFDGERILSDSRAKRLSALMFSCGFYDESGEFAFRVGMPGKSGVGGGIVAIIPGELSIAVWSPELNKYGNSFIGIETLEKFTTDIGKSIF